MGYIFDGDRIDIKNIETIKFWNIIKIDYERNKNTYICMCSELFNIYWGIYEKYILEFAKMFLIEKNITDYYVCGGFIFCSEEISKYYNICINQIDNYHKRSIRLSFINYMINMLKDRQTNNEKN
jgi:hypothetical protein